MLARRATTTARTIRTGDDLVSGADIAGRLRS
jgi:hypothetical protein